MLAYRVRDWNKLFENNRSRQVKTLDWVAIPNRHDGEGFAMVMAHPVAAEVFAAWILILQVASRCHPRGSLLRDDGTPLTPSALAMKTRGKEKWFEIAIPFLANGPHWLEEFGCQDGVRIASGGCQCLDHRREGQGREEKGTTPQEGVGVCVASAEATGRLQVVAEATPAKNKFAPPTEEEVKLHFAKCGMPESQAEMFMAHYTSNGWKVGRNPMRCWKAAAVNWRKNWESARFANPHAPPQKPKGRDTLLVEAEREGLL